VTGARTNDATLGIVRGVATVASLLVDRYELLECVGSGGMGTVHRAHDRRLDRDVAVKIPTLDAGPTARERFRREARAAARLSHPNIVRVYDWDERDGAAYIVMEYVDGPSLRDVLAASGRIPVRDAAGIGAQIADALAHAHSHGVVHRDVKPSNVLLERGRVVKVTDFGIAHSTESETITDPGAVVGTIGYLSPEQLRGARADARSDVYSLGMLLATIADSSRGPLDPVIRRATAPEPADRYQRATELRDALHRVARAEPVMAIPVVIPPPRAPRAASSRVPTPIAPTAPVPVVPVAPVAAPAPTTPSRRSARRAARASGRAAAHAEKLARPRRRLRVRSTRVWRVWHVLAILLPIVLLGAGAIAYTRATSPGPSVVVPEVVNRGSVDAAVALRAVKLGYRERLVDSPTPAGLVLEQRPRSGQEIEVGSRVVIVVSRVQSTVPHVAGLMADDAQAVLARAGFTAVSVTQEDRDDEQPGTVLRSTPEEGQRAAKAAPFTLVVARSPYVQLPGNFVGLDEATAAAKLTELGLVGKKETMASRTVAAGVVLSANPGVGQPIRRGSTVTYRVSTGPRQVALPSTVGLSRGDAQGELEDRGFHVVVDLVVASNSLKGKVVTQSPTGGTAPEGSTVTINVGTTGK
jgi:serine/threonine-protein kinase